MSGPNDRAQGLKCDGLVTDVLLEIITDLSHPDLLSFRLCCRMFAAVGLTFITRQPRMARFYLQQGSLENAIAICVDSMFCARISTITMVASTSLPGLTVPVDWRMEPDGREFGGVVTWHSVQSLVRFVHRCTHRHCLTARLWTRYERLLTAI
jgi:hypothetical protein